MPPRIDTPEARQHRTDLGALMRARRDELGMTREQVVVAMGLGATAQSQLAKMERGDVDPTYTTLLRWAAALDMRVVITPR